jgi:GNAT superfamily N-acetyltransferase
VRPEVRSSGVGSALFRAAEDWSRRRGCRTLKVETQNINLPACRFYVHMGEQRLKDPAAVRIWLISARVIGGA